MTNLMTMTGVLDLIERTETQVPVMVNLAYQPDLEREVIIKRMTPAAADDPRLRGRFAKEARMMASLHHHGIAQVYEAGLQDQLPYMVMEQLNGTTLQQRIDVLLGQRQRMEQEEIAQIMGSVMDALEYAHRFGMLAHDLSPDNIVLTSDGRTVLATLGRSLPENLHSAPAKDLAFASPERLFGGAVDARSDVYALGVLLYTLLANRLPFEGAGSGILMQKQGAATLPALDDPTAELPCSYLLAHVMRQATARETNGRYASVASFRAAFDGALTGTPKLKLLPQVSAGTQRRMQERRLERAAARRLSLRPYRELPATFRASIAEAMIDPVFTVEDDEQIVQGQVVEEPVQQVAVQAPFMPKPANPPVSALNLADFITIVPIPGQEDAPSMQQVVLPKAQAAAPVSYATPVATPAATQADLQAAQPYTLVVPIADPNDAGATPSMINGQSGNSMLAANLWIAAMIALGALAIGAAMMLG